MSTREIKRMWECSACNELHDTEYSAEECCQPEVFEVWVCPVCDEAHESEKKAASCCPIADISCPACLRDHSGDSMQQSAIKITGHCTTCNPLYTVEQQLAIEQLHWQATGRAERLNA